MNQSLITAYPILTCKTKKPLKLSGFSVNSYRLKIADKIENHSEYAEEHKTAHNTGHYSDNELIFVSLRHLFLLVSVFHFFHLNLYKYNVKTIMTHRGQV